MSDRQPVLVQAVRTPQGKHGGVFAETGSEELSVPLVNEMVEETGLSSDDEEGAAASRRCASGTARG